MKTSTKGFQVTEHIFIWGQNVKIPKFDCNFETFIKLVDSHDCHKKLGEGGILEYKLEVKIHKLKNVTSNLENWTKLLDWTKLVD